MYRYYLLLLSVLFFACVLPPKKTMRTIGGRRFDNIIMPGSAFYSTNFMVDKNLLPGDTVALRAGTYGHIDITHVEGIVFTNQGGVATINSFNLNRGAKNVKFMGNGTPGIRYGFKIDPTNGYFATDWQAVGELEIAFVEVDSSAMGFKISSVPGLAYPLNYQNVSIHDCLILKVGQEAMYLGRDELGGPFITGHIYKNIVKDAGRDGIQCRNGTFLIEYNTVDGTGLAGDGIHSHGYLIGGNTKHSITRFNTAVNVQGYAMFVNGWGKHEVYCNDFKSQASAIFSKNYEEQEDLQGVGYQHLDAHDNTLYSINQSALEKLHENNGKLDSVTFVNNKILRGGISFQNSGAGIVVKNVNNGLNTTPNCSTTNPTPSKPNLKIIF